MAILKQRLHRKNSSGSYDVIYLETLASLVKMDDGTTLTSKISSMDTAINGKAAASHGTHVYFSSDNPLMDGAASVGSGDMVARSNHRHPTDTSRAPVSHEHDHLNVQSSNEMNIAYGNTGADVYFNYRGSNATISDYVFANGKGGTLAKLSELAKMSYGTSDLTAGQSSLATGKIHLVYE